MANIGTWQNALGLLGLAAVIVNCALIGLSGQVTRLWPGLTTTQTIILIVTLEHIMLGLRSALKYVRTIYILSKALSVRFPNQGLTGTTILAGCRNMPSRTHSP